jgi:hypothetical protein
MGSPALEGECRGRGRVVTDYDTYTEGDLDPYLQKTIKTLIVKDHAYIVYLDEEYAVEWAYTDAYGPLSPGLANVLNRVAVLEAVPVEKEVPLNNTIAFRRMLGEAVARVLEDRDEESAGDVLDQAARYIIPVRQAVARTWNLQATLAVSLMFVVSSLVLWLERATVKHYVGNSLLQLALASAAGVVGGFVSFAYRSRQIELDPSGGRWRYYFDGLARSLGAAFGAVFVALAVKMKLVAGFLNAANGQETVALLVAGMLAGVSERLVPTLAGRLEGDAGQSHNSTDGADPAEDDGADDDRPGSHGKDP